MKLPEPYQWVSNEPGPKMLKEALKLYGTVEDTRPGKSNPVILGWAEELGIKKVYSNDEIPWCGLAMGIIAHRAGKELPAGLTWEKLLWALNWAKFGKPVPRAMLGDIITLRRQQGGHVFLYVGEDKNAYHGLGGNQSNSFGFGRFGKDRVYSVTRPPYKIGQPANVRRIILASNGIALSTNEQ